MLRRSKYKSERHATRCVETACGDALRVQWTRDQRDEVGRGLRCDVGVETQRSMIQHQIFLRTLLQLSVATPQVHCITRVAQSVNIVTLQ